MAWLIGHHGEHEKPQLPMVEQPPAMAAAVVPAVTVFVAVIAVVLSAMAPGPIVGEGGMAVQAASVMYSHGPKIGRDIS